MSWQLVQGLHPMIAGKGCSPPGPSTSSDPECKMSLHGKWMENPVADMIKYEKLGKTFSTYASVLNAHLKPRL